MSYLERGIYDYLYKTLTDGIKVLFSKRFIIFTFLLLISGVISIYVVYQDLESNVVRSFLVVQAAISISFIIAGFLAKQGLTIVFAEVIYN